MKRESLLIGRTAEGERVLVDIELRMVEPTAGMMTTEHEPVTAPFARFSAMGEVIAKHHREPHSCGQIVSQVRAAKFAPAKGWTASRIELLARTWERWHLNDARAACAHMVLPDSADYNDRKHIECSAGSGYKYGRAWLVEIIPAEEINKIIKAFGLGL